MTVLGFDDGFVPSRQALGVDYVIQSHIRLNIRSIGNLHNLNVLIFYIIASPSDLNSIIGQS